MEFRVYLLALETPSVAHDAAWESESLASSRMFCSFAAHFEKFSVKYSRSRNEVNVKWFWRNRTSRTSRRVVLDTCRHCQSDDLRDRLCLTSSNSVSRYAGEVGF